MSNIKNVEAFGKLKGIFTRDGASYKPGQPNLLLPAMDALYIKSRQSIDDVHAAKTDFNNATNVREVKFRETLKLCSRIINALKSNGAPSLTVEDAEAVVRKMYGHKLKVVATAGTEGDEAPKKVTRTARGLDYDSMADHFTELIKTVSAEVTYKPNEPELALAALNTIVPSLRGLNDTVNKAVVKLNTTRKDRSALLYSGKSSLLSTAKAAKMYVRSAYGARSVQDKEVSRLRFTKPKA